MTPYAHEDEIENSKLVIIKSAFQATAVVRATGEEGNATVHVAASEVPAVALALYEAAGLPEPLILENLSAPIGLAENGGIYAGRLAGKVLVGRRNVQPAELDPDAALMLAASIARQALAIKGGEPDPAAVNALADVIEAEDHDLDYESRWGLARAILLGGWKREPTR